MSTKYKNHSLTAYLEALSQKTPVPGGGSAAALTASLGVALIEMVANYSTGKSSSKVVEPRLRKIITQAGQIRKRLLVLVDLDAQTYLRVVETKKASAKEKDLAQKAACEVPLEVSRLCYKAVRLMPFLVKNGNKYLMSDLEVALEMLRAAYNSSWVLYNME